MTVEIEHRTMTEDDVPEVRSLVERTIRTSYCGVYSEAAIEFFVRYHGEDDIRRDLREGAILVALIDRAIVGTATLSGDMLTRVFVDPERQGLGIGGRLVRALLERARTSGLKTVRLDASLVSKAVYEHMGFVLVSDRSHDLGGGDTLPYHEMIMDL
jgi:GNAT superfamily N-acetyltransferase